MLEDFSFRCHYIGEFATTAREETIHNKAYNDILKQRDKAHLELSTLKLQSAKDKRTELILELDAKANEYYNQHIFNKTYLSKTAFTRLLKVARELKYGIKEQLGNKFVLKGLTNEEDAIRLWARQKEHCHKKLLRKNTQRFNDGLKQGEPDLLNVFEHGKVVDDIKNAYNKETFDNKHALSKLYFWQLMGYTDLLKYDWARVVFALTNTPIDMILAEFRNSLWQHLPKGEKMDDFLFSEEVKPLKTQFFRNHIYSDDGYIDGVYNEKGYWEFLVHSEQLDENYKFKPLSDFERLKVFQFKKDENDVAFINDRLHKAKAELPRLLEDKKSVEIIELSKELCSDKDTVE